MCAPDMFVFFLRIRRPPISTRTDTLFPTRRSSDLATAFKDIADPTDAQLDDFYRKNAARYTIPEQRRIRYAVIDAERFAQAAQPTDAEIASYYNQNKAAYAAKESRSFEQLGSA